VAPPPALRLHGLTKRYDNGFLALEDFDLEIPDGAFFGLLGPNGAGKTTLISAVCNLIRVSGGEIAVFGEPHDSLTARRWVGLAEQDVNLDRFLTVEETLLYHGGYFGMERTDAEQRAWEMIEAFDLREKATTRAPMLSGGMRRRLLLARALMHRPRLVILDEPTAGVDFELRVELWRYIRQLHSEGTTILLTTHYLEEADQLADRLAIVSQGKVVVEGTPAELKARLQGDAVHVELENGAVEHAERVLAGLGATPEQVLDGRTIVSRVENGGRALPGILSALEGEGIAVASVSLSRPSLDDVYLHFTGRDFGAEDRAA
jgi:ABC-2 type transport system ATP-binding protein